MQQRDKKDKKAQEKAKNKSRVHTGANETQNWGPYGPVLVQPTATIGGIVLSNLYTR